MVAQIQLKSPPAPLFQSFSKGGLLPVTSGGLLPVTSGGLLPVTSGGAAARDFDSTTRPASIRALPGKTLIHRKLNSFFGNSD